MLGNHDQISRHHCHHRGGARLLAEHAHLAEQFALAQDGQDDLAAVLVADHDLETARQHKVDIVGAIPRTHYRLPAREAPHQGMTRDSGNHVVRQAAEQRECLQGDC
ncbi:hypothetical protein SDC9_137666 [bioreactor metagenome]|uniref:Uncharacterized protein n=1 Tax=bioreactor metagenome TaxID=1076179 RepID=A0A645DMS4_9ZZZZ